MWQSASEKLTRVFLALWLCIFAVAAFWVFAIPPMAGSDDGAVAINEEAFWSGNFLPSLIRSPADLSTFYVAQINIRGLNGSQGQWSSCFDRNPQQSAKCDQKSLSDTPKITKTRLVTEYQRGEFPLPDLIIGLPIFLRPDRYGLYGSRLLAALLSSALVAASITFAFKKRRPLMILTQLVILMPAEFVIMGGIESSWLDTSLGILMWTLVSLLVNKAEFSKFEIRLLLATILLMNVVRPISWLWSTLALVIIIASLGFSGFMDVLRFARARWFQMAWILSLGIGLLWNFGFESPLNPRGVAALNPSGLGRYQDVWTNLLNSLKGWPLIWRDLIQSQGYAWPPTEYRGPNLIAIVWLLAFTAVFAAGWLGSNWRVRGISAIALLLVLLIPTAYLVHFLPLEGVGAFFSARYLLPVLCAPFLLIVGGKQSQLRILTAQHLNLLVVATLFISQSLYMYLILHRYCVGVDGSSMPWNWGNGWNPPISAVPLLMSGVASLFLFYLVSLNIAMGLPMKKARGVQVSREVSSFAKEL
jgi:Predicted membrane protein (DUF2142)